MADNVVFNKDGTYTRGGDVEEIDVQAVPKAQHSTSTAKTPATQEDHTHTGTSAPRAKPGTFNLNALRASAGRASTSVSRTTLPDSGESKFGKVDKVEKEKPAEMPMWSKEKSEELSAAAQELVAESTATVEEKVEPAEEPASEEMVPEQSEEPVKTETEDEPAAPTEVEPEPAVEAKSPEPFNLSNLQRGHTVSAQLSTPVEPETVQEIKLEEENTAPVADTAPKTTIVAEHSGNGFNIVPLVEFISQLSLDESTLARWCKNCIKASVSAPSILFYPTFNPDVRLYNYFQGRTPQWFGAVIGCGDSLAIVEIQSKSMVMQDSFSKASNSGDSVSVNGVPVVFYEERLHQTRKV